MVVRERAAVAVVWVVAVAAEVEEEAAADEDGIGEVACEEALEEEVTAEDEDATEDEASWVDVCTKELALD